MQKSSKITFKSKKQVHREVLDGVIHIQCTFNNTIITITDSIGNTLAWASAGTRGFKGTRKKTFLAAKETVDFILQTCFNLGMKEVTIRLKGTGLGRKAILKSFSESGLSIKSIADVTPVPHNGCRPPKKRRI